MIYWFIGQPGCGKTTLARRLKVHFDTRRVPSIHLDGDDLRKIFGNTYAKENFTKEWRIEQTRPLQKLVSHIADQGIHVIVSTVNPYRDVREEFKNSRTDVNEIWVTTYDVREREEFHVADFQAPNKPFISILTGSGISEDQAFETLWGYL